MEESNEENLEIPNGYVFENPIESNKTKETNSEKVTVEPEATVNQSLETTENKLNDKTIDVQKNANRSSGKPAKNTPKKSEKNNKEGAKNDKKDKTEKNMSFCFVAI